MASVAQRLKHAVASHPLAAIWLLGLGLRATAAFFAIGFFSRDDYFHVFDIALTWIDDPSFIWETSDKAGAGIRSHLVPRLVQGLLVAARSLGLTTPTAQLRFVYACFGMYASLLVPAVWLLTKQYSKRTQRLAAGLAAVYFVLPYAGTRLLIEAVSMVPLVFGLAFLNRDRAVRDLLLGGVLIGLACWFRYQVAVIGLAAAAVVLIQSRRVTSLLWLGLGAGLSIALQGVFDLWTSGEFLGPTWNNIAANLNPHAELTHSNPLTYFGMWLVLTLPPLSVFLVPLMVRAGQRAALIGVPWLAFVSLHSFVPHKEERFMLPALPLFLVLLAMTPDLLDQAKGAFFGWAKRHRTAGIVYFATIHAVLLVLAITAQTQANARTAMVALRDDPHANAVVSMGPELQLFFLDRSELPTARLGRPDLVWLGRTLADMRRKHGIVPNRFLCFAPDCGSVELMLAALALDCAPPTVFEGFWAD